MEKVTSGFQLLMTETNGVGQAFMEAIKTLGEKSSLDAKVHELAYISVLTATKNFDGLPFHMQQAKKLGATKEEIKSAVLLPMPLVGIQVAEALPHVEKLYEESSLS